MCDWFEVQWNRWNIWLDAKRDNPRCNISVRYKGAGRYGIVITRVVTTEEEREKLLRRVEAERGRVARLKSVMTLEQRAAYDAREKAIRERREVAMKRWRDEK